MNGKIVKAVQRFFDVGQLPQRADCIFVFAGRQERKVHGLQLYKAGYASRIIFSVGRFEWRKFHELGLENDGGLVDLVQETPPKKRHFFVCIKGNRATCSLIGKGMFGTMSEAAALCRLAGKENLGSLLIVSSNYHLRRCLECMEGFCSDAALRIIPVAAPPERPLPSQPDVAALVGEGIKYLLYKLLV